MKVINKTLKILYPPTQKEWSNPKSWVTEIITFPDDDLLFIQPCQWGDKVGNYIFFRKGTGSYSHFTQDNITFSV